MSEIDLLKGGLASRGFEVAAASKKHSGGGTSKSCGPKNHPSGGSTKSGCPPTPAKKKKAKKK